MFINKIKTFILLTGLTGLLLFIGNIIGGPAGIKFALFMALIINGIVYFFSDKIVLRMYRAQPLNKAQYRYVHNIVHELAESMQLPMPKLWIVHNSMANAFATGRNPQHASIAVTTGILDLLEIHELRGVLAHELSHIKNRDVLVATIAATIATAIGYLAHMLRYSAFWGAVGNNRRRNGNPFAMILVALFMPIAATLIQLAISRSREYLADETGAEYSQDPLALASALEKLYQHIPHAHLHQEDKQKATTAPLFIVHPFANSKFVSLFSTHPPMHKRIARLRTQYEKMFSQI